MHKDQSTSFPLSVIVHAAGVACMTPLTEYSPSCFEHGLLPKAHACYDLCARSGVNALEQFIVASSMSPLLGLSRQADYSASNAFLDAMVQFCGAQGLPGSDLRVGAVTTIGLGSEIPEGMGLSPDVYSMFFRCAAGSAPIPGDLIFDTPTFPQMQSILGIPMPMLNSYSTSRRATDGSSCCLRPEASTGTSASQAHLLHSS